MTTPTREQECKHEHIKTWVFEDTKEPAMWSCAYCGLKFAPEMATLTAGREQGLREAKEVCECKALASALAHVNTDEQAFHIKAEAARSCAAAIEQLRGK